VGICWRTIWKQFNSGFVIERTSKRFSLVFEGLAVGGSSRVRQKWENTPDPGPASNKKHLSASPLASSVIDLSKNRHRNGD
jgi:hypothetical protein